MLAPPIAQLTVNSLPLENGSLLLIVVVTVVLEASMSYLNGCHGYQPHRA